MSSPPAAMESSNATSGYRGKKYQGWKEGHVTADESIANGQQTTQAQLAQPMPVQPVTVPNSYLSPDPLSLDFLPVTPDPDHPRFTPYRPGQHLSPIEIDSPISTNPEPLQSKRTESEEKKQAPVDEVALDIQPSVSPPIISNNDEFRSDLQAATAAAIESSPKLITVTPAAAATSPDSSNPPLTNANDKPSSFHSITHFLLRLFSLACLLMCAMIRINLFGLLFLFIFFINIALMAFKQFQKNPTSSPIAQPILSPLLPFILPGFVVSLLGLLSIAAIQIARVKVHLDGDILRQVGMTYTENASGDHIAILFVPYLVTFIYFALCLTYIIWMRRSLKLLNRTVAQKQAAEEAALAAFQAKNLDEPLEKLIRRHNDRKKLKSFTPEQKKMQKDKLHAKYEILLAKFLKSAKADRQSQVQLHQGSALWNWYECKLYHPLIHMGIFVILLLVGILERSVLSYVYYLSWSVVITKWSILDRIPPTMSQDEWNMKQQQSKKGTKSNSNLKRDPTHQPLLNHTNNESVLRTEEIELVEVPTAESKKTSVISELAPLPDAHTKAAYHSHHPSAISTTHGPKVTATPPAPQLSSSLFSSFPTYVSFPLVSFDLPLFRLYQFIWIYSTLHLILKYIFRGLFIFNYGTQLSSLSDLTSVDSVSRSHILFFMGEYAIPNSMDSPNNVEMEEGWHLGLLLALNLYLGLVLHLSRRPFIFLPITFGTKCGFTPSSNHTEQPHPVEKKIAPPSARRLERALADEQRAASREEERQKRASVKLQQLNVASPGSQSMEETTQSPPVNMSSPDSDMASPLSAPPAMQHTISPSTAYPLHTISEGEPKSAGEVFDSTEARQLKAAEEAEMNKTLPPPASTSGESKKTLTYFQHWIAFLARSMWFFLPATCFMLAVLYASYPGLVFLVCMFLSAYYSLSLSFQLLPFLLCYTQGINHTHYIFHLINNYWNDSTVTGESFLTNITIRIFLAFLFSSLAVAYLAYTHRYAHRGILFWEHFYGFTSSSLITGPPGHSPLGLLSPRLGHHEVVMKRHRELVEEKLRQWKAEDEERAKADLALKEQMERTTKEFRRRQKERKERLKKMNKSEQEEEAEALRKVIDDESQRKASRAERASSADQHDSPLMHIIIHEEEAKDVEHHEEVAPAASSSTPPQVIIHSATSPPPSQTPPVIRIHSVEKLDQPVADSASPIPRPQPLAISPSYVPSTGSNDSAFHVTLTHHKESTPVAPPPPPAAATPPPIDAEAAAARARKKLAQHTGFKSEEAYAAAQIQAAFRGKKARQHMEQKGIPIIVPLEQSIKLKLHRQKHAHHHHHHKKKKPPPPVNPLQPQPSILRRTLHGLKKGVTNLGLFFFSYSNLLIMVLLYVIGILRVDIIHGVYMLLFLLYAISPWMRRHHGVVVGWSCLVIFMEYLWNLSHFRDQEPLHNTWTDRVGLVPMFPFNRNIFPHVSMLILAGCFHRFSPEEAAQAQIHLNQMDREARLSGKPNQTTRTHSDDSEPSVEYLNRTAYSAYWYSPYQPFYRSIVTAGLMLCTAITLWAGLVNSLMTADTVNEDNNTTTTTTTVSQDIGVSLISGIYLLFVFALLLVHQIRPGLRAYPYDRAILFLLCIYSGGIVLLQYVYQFGVLDSSMTDLAKSSNDRFSAAEIGVFKTPGSLYKSLLSHSIVLFICVGQLRILRLDSDPVTGKSISLTCSKNGSVENVLEYIEDILNASESRLKRAELKKQSMKAEKEKEKARLAELQKRKIAAFEANDFELLHAEFAQEHEREMAKIIAKEEAKQAKKLRLYQQAQEGTITVTEARMRRRTIPMTLMIHFFARLLYYSFVFCDWFLLQHSDKILGMTLFLVAISHINLFGAWYMFLAFITLLVLGYPRLKAMLAIISSQIFIIICFLWQFPVESFDQDRIEFTVIGLNKDPSFGHVAFHHIAVMLMGCFYGATYFWLRIHQRKTLSQNQVEEFEAYQEKLMRQREEMEMNKTEEAEAVEEEDGQPPTIIEEGDEQEDEQNVAPATTNGMPPNTTGSLSRATSLDANTLALPPGSPTLGTSNSRLSVSHRRTHSRSPSRARAMSRAVAPPPPTLHKTSPLRLSDESANVLPALLASLPNPSNDTTTPVVLTPEQHSSVILYNHLQSRLYHSQFLADNQHPSSRKDDIIQDLQNMNLDILLQNNVGPSDKKGRPRYQIPHMIPSGTMTAGGLTMASPNMTLADEEQRITQTALLEAADGISTSPSPAVPSPATVAPPVVRSSPIDLTGENSDDSENEEHPLRDVQSWMMTVPLSEHSHRLSREKKLKQKRRAAKLQAKIAEREAKSTGKVSTPVTSPKLTSSPSPSTSPPSASTANATTTSSTPGPTIATIAPAYNSPQTLTDEAAMFSLASSAVRLNQVDPISQHHEKNVKRASTGDADEVGMITATQSSAPPAVSHIDGSIATVPVAPHYDLDRMSAFDGDATIEGDGGAKMNRSYWHRFFRALLGDDGLFVFCARVSHYIGFFHLALISLLAAAYSNANTIFSLYYIAVTGILSYVGTQTANRYWRPLVGTLTLCLIAKYAIGIANITSEYRCRVNPSGFGTECSRWIIWLGKGTTLWYWDAAAWMMVVIHYSFLRIYAKIELQMEERKRIEREEPWELKSSARSANPIERAAHDGAAEGAVETFLVAEEPTANATAASKTQSTALMNVASHSGAASVVASTHAKLAESSPKDKDVNGLTADTKLYHRFSPAVQFPPISLQSPNSRPREANETINELKLPNSPKGKEIKSPSSKRSSSPPPLSRDIISIRMAGSNDVPPLLDRDASLDLETQLANERLHLKELKEKNKRPAALSPSGFPSYHLDIHELEPIPTYITITYTTTNNQLSSYLISNFMTATADSMNDAQNSISDYLHFCLFRGCHYFALILVICLATTYFNMMSFVYFGLCLAMLWEGDTILDGTKQFYWDYFYILTYVIILLRLIYQFPIFHLTYVVTNWSTVLGFYKVNLDDCVYDPTLGGDKCITTPYTGLIPTVIILDILIFGVILLIRTLLARKEMVFVRHYIREQRKIGSVRSELISLQLEHDRLLRTYREQHEAIRRLQRVTELKEIKIQRELKLQQERVLSGQQHIIEGWETAGISMGVQASKKAIGADEDAMARASIRNHAISQLKGAAPGTIGPSLSQLRPKAVDAPLPLIGDETIRLSSGRPLSAAHSRRKSSATATRASSASPEQSKPTTIHEGSRESDDQLEDVGKLGTKSATFALPPQTIASPTAPTSSAGSASDSDTKPLLQHRPTPYYPVDDPHAQKKKEEKKKKKLKVHSHESKPDEEDPVTLLSALRSNVFELRLVEERMKKLRHKKSIENLNKDDELPLLLLKFYELSWVRSFTSIFTSKTHSIFKDESTDDVLLHEYIFKKDEADLKRTQEEQAKLRGTIEDQKKEQLKEEEKVAKKATSQKKKKAQTKEVKPTTSTITTIDPSAAETTQVTTVTQSSPRTETVDQAALPPSTQISTPTTSTQPLTEVKPATPSQVQQPVTVTVHDNKPALDVSNVTQAAANERHMIVRSSSSPSPTSTPPTKPKSPPASNSAASSAMTTQQPQPVSKYGNLFANDDDSEDEEDIPEPSLPAQIWEFFTSLLLNSTWFLVCFFFLLEYLVEPSLLTVIYPFALFLYGLLTYPRPPRWFWEMMMMYTTLLLLLKFLFQFPCFCVCTNIYGQFYSLCALSEEVSCSITASGVTTSSTTSLESIIGLKKLLPRSSAQDGDFMRFIGGAFLDFCVLGVLYFHRRYLRIHGLWLSSEEITLRKNQHEHLMAKMVKTAIMKEKIREWKDSHPEEAAATEEAAAADLKTPIPIAKMDKKSKVGHTRAESIARARDEMLRQKLGKRVSLSKRSGIESDIESDELVSVAFVPAPDGQSVELDVQALHHTSPSPLPTKYDRASPPTPSDTKGSKKSKKIKSQSDDSTPSLSLDSKKERKRSIRSDDFLASTSSHFPLEHSASLPVSKKFDTSSSTSAPLSRSASKANLDTEPKSKRSFIGRMSAMFSTGKMKLLSAISDNEDDDRRSPDLEIGGAKHESDDDEDNNKETSGLLGSRKKRPSKIAVAAASASPIATDASKSTDHSHSHSHAIRHARSASDLHKLEKQRLEARAQLAKQVAKERERRLKKSLKGLNQAERKQALKEARRIQERMEEREKRHQTHMKQRMKLKQEQRELASPKKKKENPVVRFGKYLFHTLGDTTYKPGKDYYIYIFLIQLLQFIVLVIFYNLSDSAGSISQNYISPQFVLVIFAQFVHIVLERTIYLYRQLFLKIMLQVATMVTFFIISLYVGLGSNALLNVIYVLMCGYWVLSSLQYYHGYPASTQGQFLAKSTHWLPSTIFTIYRAIPFVFELRTLLDWICTDTVLYFVEWLKFEDIYATFFLTQCKCDSRRNSPVRAGTKQPWWMKLLIGLGLFILLIIVVWGPLFLFSSQSATHTNPVLTLHSSVKLPGFVTLYSSEQSFIVASEGNSGDQYLTDDQYAELVHQHSFLSAQRQRDLQIIYPLGASSSVWTITPLARQNLISHLNEPNPTTAQALDFSFSFTRSTATAAPNTQYQYRYTLSKAQMNTLAQILNGTTTGSTVNGTALLDSSTGGTQSVRRRRLLQVFNDSSSSSSTGSTFTSSTGVSSSSTGTDSSSSAAVTIYVPANRTSSLLLPNCYPAFLTMSSTDSTGPVTPLSLDESTGMNNCLLTLITASDQFGIPMEWWILSDAGSFGQIPKADLTHISVLGGTSVYASDGTLIPQPIVASETYATGYDGAGIGPPVYVYSGEIPSGNSLNLGLVGVYVTVVLAIGRFLRMYVMGTSKSIMWDDLQDALPVLNICRDLYTARLHLQLKLEQQLYVELINLLRSPETLLLRTGEYIHYWPKDGSSEESSDSYSEDEEDEDDSNSVGSRTSSSGASSSSAHEEDEDEEDK